MLNGGSMVWGFCVYFVYMIPLETASFPKREIHLKEQRKEYWIGNGAKTIYKQRI